MSVNSLSIPCKHHGHRETETNPREQHRDGQAFTLTFASFGGLK